MDEQKKTTPHELEQILSSLFDGYGLVTKPEFVDKLASNEFQVIKLANNCYALITWQQDVMHVLTCTGSVTGSRGALESIERYAEKNGASKIVGMARKGWQELLQDMEFTVFRNMIYFQKELK